MLFVYISWSIRKYVHVSVERNLYMYVYAFATYNLVRVWMLCNKWKYNITPTPHHGNEAKVKTYTGKA